MPDSLKGVALSLVLLLTVVATGNAQTMPARIIPRSAQISRPTAIVFGDIKNLLAAKYTLVDSNEMTGRLVARRSAIAPGTWTQWAFCKVSPLDLLDKLQDSSVVLTVTIAPSGSGASYVTVSADFNATYAIGSQATSVACDSNGVLENEILDSAGARPGSH